MNTLEDLRVQFNTAWEENLADRIQRILNEILEIALDPSQRERALALLVYWSKYNDSFDEKLDHLFDARHKALQETQQKVLQQIAEVERKTQDLNQQFEKIQIIAEIETLEHTRNELAGQRIEELQERITQTKARVDERRQGLVNQLQELRQMGETE